MALVDSRVGVGTLTIGTNGWEEQITNVKLVPDVESEDPEPTLADVDPLPVESTSWTLEGEAIQDWADSDGFVRFCFANSGAEVPFSFVPNTADGVEFTGTCKVRAIEIGGDAKVRNKSSFEFPVSGLTVL
jgi:hypothetical protein